MLQNHIRRMCQMVSYTCHAEQNRSIMTWYLPKKTNTPRRAREKAHHNTGSYFIMCGALLDFDILYTLFPGFWGQGFKKAD